MKLKKMFYYIIAMFLLTFNVFNVLEVNAEDNCFYEEFGPFSNVELDKEWNIVFNLSDDINRDIKVWIEDSLRNTVPITETIVGNKLVIEPKSFYKANENFVLYIAKASNSRLKYQHKVNFKTKTVDSIAPSVEQRIVEIQQKWNILKPVNNKVVYTIRPSTIQPYVLGQLTDNTLNEALDITNFIRYVSYLPDVMLDEQFNIEAQAASVVNAANNKLTHYPNKPFGMDDALFELGAKGARSSNLGAGYRTIIDSITNGYMEDGDPGNISKVGHRRWVLSPNLKKVGFGYAHTTYGYEVGYTGMRVIEDGMYGNPYEPYDFISWPAQTAMPTKLFKKQFPWSISLNTDRYNKNHLRDIEVELTRLNDNKTWKMSENSNEGYFNIDTDGYGNVPFTVIFRPNEELEYSAGDQYRVTISNLRRLDGEKAQISYETTFFDLR